ncbi:hypothetical protein ASG50_16695 [Rhizobium sp. Leaf386]|nr:hypothetical protein ASG50_16695 [Rhizobium sp. Leaf386]
MIVRKAKRVQNFLCGLAAIGMAVVFAFANFPSSRVNFNLAVHGVAVNAMVVGEERKGSGKQRKVYPFFEFDLTDDSKVVAKSYTVLALTSDRKRRPVEVIYDPSNPQIVLPRKHLLFWKFIWVWVLLAIAVSLFLYGTYLLRKALSRRAEEFRFATGD